ncbi:MAG TPA: muconolactone Delta-isomerase family protein [Pseudolabrys sp.]|nr:muconolactone Delta-isomerase family protein [Pseudolabrys sp.]
MLFMLNIDVSVPADVPQERKDELRRRENDRAIELMKEGKLRRIWRIVGQTANYSVWEAETLEELHSVVGSMPLYPYMKIDVTPVIEHPVTEAWSKVNGPLPAF